MSAEEEAAAPLTIQLFGPFDVRRHGRPLPRLRTRKEQWLLALLTLRHGRALERDWLAGTLWPETAESRALFYLRRSLCDLRRALGDEAARLVTSTPGVVSLDLSGAECDVTAFDAVIARGSAEERGEVVRAALERAVRLYGGPLLDGCHEEWILGERAVREQAYLTALETLAREALARGEPEAAARALRQALATDPFRESAQRALMQALAAGGDYASATLAYRAFRLRLQQELLTEPAPETKALFQQLRAEARRPPVRRPTTDDRPPILSVPAPRVEPARTPLTPSPLHPLTPSFPGRLPSPWSTFIGRETELAEIAACLARERLVTLTGIGGVGKTRLAIRVAEELAEEMPEGAWFVDLAPLADPAMVSPAVAAAVDLPRQRDRPLIDALQEFLGPQSLLLVLDNCEHVLESCAQLVDALLSAAPRLRILATSRQSLGLPGEAVWRVPPLSVPDPTQWSMVEGQGSRVEGQGSRTDERPGPPDSRTSTLDPRPLTLDPRPSTMLQYEAVHLFVERARQADRSFPITWETLRTVAQVCHRLDGIPLALELVAARLKAMSLAQAAAHLEDRFRPLRGGSRTAQARHQTLRATMDWSFDLLSEPERALLLSLSVFAGGFTLEAASAICDFGFWILDFGLGTGERANKDAQDRQDVDFRKFPIQNPKSKIQNLEVLDLLTALVDKSLVEAGEAAGEGRYRLLEAVREYSGEKLRQTGEAPGVQARHRDWFDALAERAAPELQGPEQASWLGRLEREYGNFHAALEWSLDRGEGEQAVRLAGALWRFLYVRGHIDEGREWLERALSAGAEVAAAARAGALHGAAMLCHEQGEFATARSFEERSLALWRESGDEREIAAALDQLGHIVNAQGDHERAVTLFEESLALRRKIGDEAGAAASLNALGYMARLLGDYTRAATLCGESLRLRRELCDSGGMAYSLEFLSQLAIEQGDYERAAVMADESLALREQLEDRRGIAATLLKLGNIARNRGDLDAALTHYERSLRLWQELHSVPGSAACLVGMGETACARGRYTEGAALYQESLLLWQQVGQKPRIAECLECLAEAVRSLEQPEQTARLLAAAEAVRTAVGAPLAPNRQTALQHCRDAARTVLGEQAFAGAWAEGRAMTLDDAVAYAREIGPRPS